MQNRNSKTCDIWSELFPLSDSFYSFLLVTSFPSKSISIHCVPVSEQVIDQCSECRKRRLLRVEEEPKENWMLLLCVQLLKDWVVTADRQQQKRQVHVSNWRAGNWSGVGVILVVNEGLRKKKLEEIHIVITPVKSLTLPLMTALLRPPLLGGPLGGSHLHTDCSIMAA